MISVERERERERQRESGEEMRWEIYTGERVGCICVGKGKEKMKVRKEEGRKQGGMFIRQVELIGRREVCE